VVIKAMREYHVQNTYAWRIVKELDENMEIEYKE
jgi:hypothetical protein